MAGVSQPGGIATEATAAKAFDDTITTGTINANGQTVTQAVPEGASNVLFYFGITSFSATVQFELSFDGGTAYIALESAALHTASVVTGTSPTANAAYNAALPPGATHVRVRCSAFTSGSASVTVAVGHQGIQPVNQVPTTLTVVPSGSSTAGTGLSVAKILAAANTNATNVKATSARVYGWHLHNVSAAVKYVRLFNKATAPTVGTDSPLEVIPIPAGTIAQLAFTVPITFGTGFGYAITGAVADLDTTAVAANDVVGSVFYV